MTNHKKRGLSSDRAREVRQRGHDDALEFALSIGLNNDYKNDSQAKKDVIDPSGDAHSVKGGQKKWQIFLYGLGRFQSDEIFAAMNGVGQLLIECINAFPPSYEEYQDCKKSAKESLAPHMRSLADRLQTQYRLKAFLNKSLFNGGEVNYWTIKHNGLFHIFHSKDVVTVMSECFEVCNSHAMNKTQFDSQKVVFKYKGLNVGEIEMRNDSVKHYREVRFNMLKQRVMNMLFEKIPQTKVFSSNVLLYGQAEKKFGRW